MQPTLNPWLVSYVSQYYQTKSRYEIDRYLIEVGYEPQDIEAVWQSLNTIPEEGRRKSLQTRQHLLKIGKALRRASLKQLIFGAATILVLFLAFVIIFDPILPILHSPHTKIKYATSPTAKLSPDGNLLAVGTEKIEIWNVSDQKVLRAFGSIKYNRFWWSADSQYLALNPAEGTIQIWRVSDGILINSLENRSRETAFDFATEIIFNSDKNLLLWTYSYSNSVSRRELWQINGQTRTLIKTLPESSYFKSFSQDKRLLVFSDSASDINILRIADDTLIKTFNISNPKKYGPTKFDISTAAFGVNNEILVLGFKDGTIQLWRISDNKLLITINFNKESIGGLAFSSDGQFLASTNHHCANEEGCSADDASIKLWRVSDGTLIKKFVGHSDVINSLSFSADGQTLISTSEDNTLRFWPVK